MLFFGCTSLTSIVLPSVKDIGNYAFEGCTQLRSVTLEQEGYVSIQSKAFSGCEYLEEFTVYSYSPENPEQIIANAASDAFKSSFVENGILHVPEAAIALYKADATWGKFNNITSLSSASKYHKLYVDVNAKGEVVYGTGVRAKTITNNQTFDVKEKEDIVLTLTPNEDCKLGKVTVNDVDKTDAVVNGVLTITDVNGDQNVSVEFVDVFNVEYVDANDELVKLALAYDDNENNKIALADGSKSLIVKEDIPLKQISYKRNFTNTKWQSLYVPFEIPITAELLEEFEFAYINGAKLYDWDDDGDSEDVAIEIFKVKKGILRANHPYMIRAKEIGEKTITVNEATLYATKENSIDCSTTELLFSFNGGYSTLNDEDLAGCYLLGNGTWNPVREGGTMKPMRYYLKIESRGTGQVIPASASAKPIRITVYGEDGDATEINSQFIIDNSQLEAAPVFDLQGREVEHSEKGIYIINGKKVLVQ